MGPTPLTISRSGIWPLLVSCLLLRGCSFSQFLIHNLRLYLPIEQSRQSAGQDPASAARGASHWILSLTQFSLKRVPVSSSTLAIQNEYCRRSYSRSLHPGAFLPLWMISSTAWRFNFSPISSGHPTVLHGWIHFTLSSLVRQSGEVQALTKLRHRANQYACWLSSTG
jgi:hypothetical protein